MPWQRLFWAYLQLDSRMYFSWWMGALLLCWPIATATTLLIFVLSLRRAGIRLAQLLRTVIYCWPAGILIAGGLSWWALTCARDTSNTYWGITDATPSGWLMVQATLVIIAIGGYRLAMAFRRYLRLHAPIATALATQIIVALVFVVLIELIADFSRRV